MTLTPSIMMTLTLGAFIVGSWVQRKSRVSLLHPVIIAMVLIIAVLKISGISYTEYFQYNSFIHYLLGPSVVALGVSLYEQLSRIKGNVTTIFVSVFSGCVVAILSVVLVGRLFGLDESVIRSFEPKSVTTPIAISLAEGNGGIVSLTVVAVVLCGIVGAVFGPKILDLIHVRHPLARGLAMGTASHGIGTARAIQMGALEGAVSGLAIALMGMITSLFLPLYHLIA